ncbi:T9SS type A sorting domain-containing protein [uncultured Mucilaginibacter sp.]|uniref:T9SS type A sorting domain-containing protein n=1 Tax=uncultured Mucilaginibacter sp. TaxID=797541 RepID=UPI0025F96B82|nr:T9SS type A sorting domain-containing protein [uncultured Mucilaginibacter sp.]
MVLFVSGQVVCAQYLSRSVVANQAETLTSPNLILTYVLGEPISDFLPNTTPGTNAPIFLTAGFHQPDIDVQTMLGTNISSSLVLYPNPASGGTVKLAFNHVPDGIYTVNLVDASGKILQTQSVTYSNHNFFYLTLDVSHLAGGIYFISVVNQLNFQGQVKLIKI